MQFDSESSSTSLLPEASYAEKDIFVQGRSIGADSAPQDRGWVIDVETTQEGPSKV